ncbi:MAG TPA: hypothetical protein VGD26_12120 [Chitinophagaceae bacterium]
MATFNKFNSFPEALAEKVHNLASDQLVVALCATANAPVATNSVLADLVQIAYTNLSTRNIVTGSSAQSGGVYKLVLNDLVLTASGAVAAFQYVVVYNDTALNKELICWYNHGTAITLANGETFTINFDGTNGLFTLG